MIPLPPRRLPEALPIPLTPLIGRERELATARALIQEAGARLLTLTGPGGIGKTRLAIAIAADLRDAFPEGVAWVPLAAIHDGAAVIPAMLEALGIGQGSLADPRADLVRALGDSRLLLVLDNFEQVLGAAGDLAEVLAACPGITVLATSRTRLRLRGEQVLPVAPLGLHDQPEGATKQHPTTSDAVRLFADRARAIDPTFALTASTELVAEEICRRLDGLPLAIELAAARVNLLSPAILLARLERRLPLLTSGAADAPARQRTLRDAIDWSHRLLSPAEQTLFRRLAVFASGFTLEAAEAVCLEGVALRSGGEGGRGGEGTDEPSAQTGTDPLPPEPQAPPPERSDTPSVLDNLAALVDGHLVWHQPEGVAGPRYGLFETIHEYAAEQLSASGEEEVMRRRHAAFFLADAELHEIAPFLPIDRPQRERLEVERPNVRAALASFKTDGEDVRLRRFVAAVGYFWWIGGHLHERLPWLERAIALADRAAAAGESPDILPRIAVPYGAIIASGGHDFERAERVLTEALARTRHIGDRRATSAVLLVLGFVDNMRGTFDQAVPRFEEALALARSVPDPRQAAALSGSALTNLGDALRFQGKLHEAAAHCGEALLLHQAIGHHIGMVHDVVDLGLVSRDGEDWATATARFREGLRLATPAGERRYIVVALEGLATVLTATAHVTAAARLFGAAERLRETTGVIRHYPADRDANERAHATLRTRLSEPALAAAWTAGRTLSLEQAVAEALTGSPPPHDPGTDSPQGGAKKGATQGILSPRELDVVRLIATGKTDREIGEALFISTRTVEGHVARILEKLGVRTRTAAASAAIVAGWIALPNPPHTPPET